MHDGTYFAGEVVNDEATQNSEWILLKRSNT